LRKLSAESGAAAVVVEVMRGEILAAASTPAFDPNLFVKGIAHDDWETLSGSPYRPLLDKTLAGQYAPGSTFKVMTAPAALDASVVAPQDRFFCPGFLKLGNSIFHCWKREGHGHVDMFEAIKQSC